MPCKLSRQSNGDKLTSALTVSELLALRPTLGRHFDSVVDVGLGDVALVQHHVAEAVEVGDGAHLGAALGRRVGPPGDRAHALAQLVDAALRRHVPCPRQHQQRAHRHSHHLRPLHLANSERLIDETNREWTLIKVLLDKCCGLAIDALHYIHAGCSICITTLN